MARIDYYQIEKDIRDHLADDSDLQNATILIEENLSFQTGDVIVIYLKRRDLAPVQTISAGTRVRYDLILSIWCFHFALELSTALENRDDLVGKVEVALLSNRSNLENKIGKYLLEGGEFETAETGADDVTFFSAAELELRVFAEATT